MYSRLESRLNAQHKADESNEFLREYERLGHMVHVQSPNQADNQIVYIMRSYAKIASPSYLRIIFNASQPTSNSLSLNDHFMIGPKLQTDFPSVVIS